MKKRLFKINLQLFADPPVKKDDETDEAFQARLSAYNSDLEKKKSEEDNLNKKFEDFGKTMLEQIKSILPSAPVAKTEDTKAPVPKLETDDISSLVEKELSKRESEKAYNSFAESIGKVDGVNLDVFKGLPPSVYSEISKITGTKKTMDEAEFNKLVEAKATEMAKKILSENKEDKKVDTKDANEVFKMLGLKTRV